MIYREHRKKREPQRGRVERGLEPRSGADSSPLFKDEGTGIQRDGRDLFKAAYATRGGLGSAANSDGFCILTLDFSPCSLLRVLIKEGKCKLGWGLGNTAAFPAATPKAGDSSLRRGESVASSVCFRRIFNEKQFPATAGEGK